MPRPKKIVSTGITLDELQNKAAFADRVLSLAASMGLRTPAPAPKPAPAPAPVAKKAAAKPVAKPAKPAPGTVLKTRPAVDEEDED